MALPTATVVLPGQILGPASQYRAGPGTHMHEANLHSSLLGVLSVTKPERPPGPAKRLTKITALQQQQQSADQLPMLSVSRQQGQQGQGRRREVLPEVGNVVLARVTRIAQRQAVVSILVCGDGVLEAEWQGVIRVQDVRATEKDRVRIHESFRPGDIVRAEVISLGDQANYYLSTARNELGVIMATSEAGNAMVPVSWREYRDAETGLGESRKVARPL